MVINKVIINDDIHFVITYRYLFVSISNKGSRY